MQNKSNAREITIDYLNDEITQLTFDLSQKDKEIEKLKNDLHTNYVQNQNTIKELKEE